MSSDNSTLLDNLLFAPLCDGWSNNTEGAIYHLGNTMLFLGYMGGSGAYGCLFIFGFLTPAFLCLTLWGWMTMCGLDVFTWNLLLLLACFVQICHLLFRLHQEGIRREELTSLYQAVYLPLGVPVQVFKEIASAFENKVVELKAGETYAVEGKTPINQLSFLLSGRINVSLEGQFLHYIHRHQFLDSPEWESLRPNEEGKFQVTLTAEEDSRYISWRRRRLYMLISKERYIARLFSVMLGYDIAEKLYNLNNKLYIKSGVLLDIRLPSLYHVLAPSSQSSEGGSCSDGGIAREQQTEQQDEDQALVHEKPDPAQPQPLQPHLQGPMKSHLDEPQAPRRDHYQHPWASDPELPTGEDSTSLVLEDFADVAGSLMDYGSERDYLR
ncbi:popeye domain-containing protein 2 isoform X1 [Seriola lalandi dorsalis]|uniref:Popeye domain cAMP effector 2 n=1 Tax=Seriola lalandi dorsalis TaxID=1841481 RepID=A0A3B4XF72_SERLL|nr:popeye domain-containing protein 2 isoform X1 [Seriola lalandi dorsalis]XP_056244850.1 popeye domain-containing 2 isoform X1 [Seriola aureovittata]